MPEHDHDALLTMSGDVSHLVKNVDEMRGEVRQNTKALTGIKVTLAHHGINGGGRHVTLSRPVVWMVGALAALALGGVLTVDLVKADKVAKIASLVMPGK